MNTAIADLSSRQHFPPRSSTTEPRHRYQFSTGMANDCKSIIVTTQRALLLLLLLLLLGTISANSAATLNMEANLNLNEYSGTNDPHLASQAGVVGHFRAGGGGGDVLSGVPLHVVRKVTHRSGTTPAYLCLCVLFNLSIP